MMMERPKCQYCEENLALMLLGRKFACGDCLMKYQKNKQDKIDEVMNDN